MLYIYNIPCFRETESSLPHIRTSTKGEKVSAGPYNKIYNGLKLLWTCAYIINLSFHAFTGFSHCSLSLYCSNILIQKSLRVKRFCIVHHKKGTPKMLIFFVSYMAQFPQYKPYCGKNSIEFSENCFCFKF